LLGVCQRALPVAPRSTEEAPAMSTVLEASPLPGININTKLFEAINEASQKAISMCGSKIRCVGVSSVPTQETGVVTGMIGVHGKASGFVAVSMAERFAICAVEGLLSEHFGKLCSQVVDGVGEIANIITGGIKAALSKTNMSFTNITVPSVIVGQNFTIAYARGLEFLTVTFEHDDVEAIRLEERTMQVSISLLVL
jgi:chemotaxis protein CheX